MIDMGWCRKQINGRIGRIKRCFEWAASEELVPVEVYQKLATVAGLEAGRSRAGDRPKVEPVADEYVNATVRFLNRHVRGLVTFQRLTGCRPSEACRLRMCELDTSGGDVWVYRPARHKNKHRGKPRAIPIGPRGQQLIREYMTADLNDYLFFPRRAVKELHAARTAARKTPMYRSHMKRNAAKQVRHPKRSAGRVYTLRAYELAVERAVEKANDRRAKLAAGCEFDAVPRWSPGQLRHTVGTEVRKKYGLEGTQVLLGHSRADVTLAAQIAREVG